MTCVIKNVYAIEAVSNYRVVFNNVCDDCMILKRHMDLGIDREYIKATDILSEPTKGRWRL